MNHALSMLPRTDDPQFLGREPLPEVRVLLQAASLTAYPAKAEALLRECLILDPYCLDTYLGFCRLFIREERVAEAENAALAALCMAAHAAGLESDWRLQQRQNYQWSRPDAAERYYLMALEVLGAVRLMQGNRAEHQAIIQKLAELGATVSARRSLPARTTQNTTLVAPAQSGMQVAPVGA